MYVHTHAYAGAYVHVYAGASRCQNSDRSPGDGDKGSSEPHDMNAGN